MNVNLGEYKTLIFDCDGVLLDSNRLKTEAFRVAALPYGEAAAERLVQHHVEHGGISRYRKFKHFLAEIVPATLAHEDSLSNLPGYEALLETYAAAVRDGLRTCAISEGLASLREQTPDARWLVVSGGDQVELRAVFAERGIAEYFDGGIFGSPDSKGDIVAREIEAGNIRRPTIFFGDSRLDHEVSAANDFDFLFVSQWTEMPDWPGYLKAHGLSAIDSLNAFNQQNTSEAL